MWDANTFSLGVSAERHMSIMCTHPAACIDCLLLPHVTMLFDIKVRRSIRTLLRNGIL